MSSRVISTAVARIVSVCCFAVLAVIFTASPAWALPEKGTPAPPLQFAQLLQAPQGAKTDWASLHGKVVVVEFWATWCGPCVAAIPHLNQLVASLDPAKFQFISVDDEDPKVVASFLAKKKMSGWIGLDQTAADFAWYGADSRPTTVIVDGQGKVVAATNPELLKAADLIAVSEGKPVKFEPVPDLKALMASVKPANEVKPIFELEVSKSAPDAKFWMTAGGNTIEIHAADAKFLLTYAYRVPQDRLILSGTLPEGKYDFRVNTAGADDAVASSLMQTAVVTGLNLQAETKKVTRKVYVLKATDETRKLLVPTASNGGGMSSFGGGKIDMVNTSLDNFAYILEGALETPVVNETGVDGSFDVAVEFAEKDAEAAKTELQKKLGIALVEEERTIPVVDVSARPEKPADPVPTSPHASQQSSKLGAQ